MMTRRVVCTGNPARSGTLASGFHKIFPDAVFLCRGTGWHLDQLDQTHTQKLHAVFQTCNTFLNCSYIAPGVQTRLLEICHDSGKHCDVVNIGSTHEYDGLGSRQYRDSKLALRDRSLQFDSFRFRTCHVILGGIKTDTTAEKQDWLDIDLICHEILQIFARPYRVPITSLLQTRRAW